MLKHDWAHTGRLTRRASSVGRLFWFFVLPKFQGATQLLALTSWTQNLIPREQTVGRSTG